MDNDVEDAKADIKAIRKHYYFSIMCVEIVENLEAGCFFFSFYFIFFFCIYYLSTLYRLQVITMYTCTSVLVFYFSTLQMNFYFLTKE